MPHDVDKGLPHEVDERLHQFQLQPGQQPRGIGPPRQFKKLRGRMPERTTGTLVKTRPGNTGKPRNPVVPGDDSAFLHQTEFGKTRHRRAGD